jgi:hypothetical protein
MSAQILIPVSVGELFDKISILRLKLEKLSDEAQLASVRYELERLESVAEQFPLDGQPGELMRTLSEVNALLWDIEDQLREMERQQDFSTDFVAAARQVYKLNDERFRMKSGLSQAFGSEIFEEKSYC